MAKDEVEIGGGDSSEDYEVVPVGPIRKLERRIDDMEEKAQKGGGMGGGRNDELVRDVLDIMKSNQKIVNDMTESTHELKNSVEDLTHKMDSVIDNMNSFMDLLSEASEADLEGEVIQDVHGRIADAVGGQMEEVAEEMKASNREVVENLQELNKSVKRSYTSDRKNQVLSKRDRNNQNQGQSQRQQGQQSQQGQRQQRDGNRQQQRRNKGLNIDRGSNNNNDNPESSERMRKLRKRFDKKTNEQ